MCGRRDPGLNTDCRKEKLIKRREFMMRRRKKYLSLLLCGAMTLSGMMAGNPVDVRADETGNVYYVSTTGDDANDGSFSSPYKTIQKATEVMQPGDTCYVRGGVYHESVAPGNNGTAGKPITITNYQEEDVVLSGCKELTGWTKDPNKDGVWKAPMDWSLGADGNKNQIFADGELMWEARYPNIQEGDTITNFTRATSKAGSGFKSGDKTQSLLVDPDLKTFATTEDFFDGATIWDVPGSAWTALTFKVTSYDPATGTLTYPSSARGMDRSSYAPKSGTSYYIFGSYGLLDAEKEWWYDDENQELYLKTPGGKNPDEAGIYVEAKEYENAIDLSGCSYINIEGIDVRGATVATDEDSSHILLKDMHCEYVSHDSELVIPDLQDNACAQDDLGILLKGTFIEVNSCEIAYSSGPLINVQGSDNKVVNCYIHDGNYIGTYSGHTKLSGRRQFISNNTMTESGRDTVSFRNLSESVVQYNDISGSARLTKDVGIMYSAETDGQNTLIHHNYIHDSYNPNTTNDNGLYPDEMTHNFIMFNNVIWNVKSNAMCLNQPSLYNLVYNNTGYNKASVSDAYQASFSDARGRQYINNHISGKNDNKYTYNASWYLSNRAPSDAGFADPENGDFTIGADSALAGQGVKVSGVTKSDNPSIGAFEPGESGFVVGHNFENPPEILDPPSVTEFEYRNLIKNGGFEYGTLEGWNGMGEVVHDTAWHARNKTAATCFYGLVMQPGQTIFQTIEVQPNTTYTIGLNSRSVDGSMVKYGAIGLQGGDEIAEVANKSASWSGTTRRFLQFTTGENDTRVSIMVSNTGENEMFVDDIGVQKNAETLSDLSKAVSVNYNDETYKAEVSFADLEEGHQYFYAVSKEQQTALKQNGFAVEKPEAYSNELNSMDQVTIYPEQWLSIVEVVGNKVVGVHDYQMSGDAIKVPTIYSVENPAPADAFYGTAAEDLNLPETLKVGLKNGGTLADIEVKWDTTNYKADEVGSYQLTGTFVLPEGILNIDDLKAEITVNVKNRTLVEVMPAGDVKGIENGTPIDQIALPDTMTLVTDGGNVDADVVWDRSKAVYDAASKKAQTFTVPGIVTLPAGVVQPEESISLNVSITVNVEAGVDKAALQALYNANRDKENQNYTADSWLAFRNGLLEAAEALGNPNATQKNVDKAFQTLQMAVYGLRTEETQPADKEALKTVYNTNKDLADAGYTADSWKAYKDALALAESVLNSDTATTEQAEYAAQVLLDAVNGLTVQQNPDKVVLQKMFNDMSAVKADNYTAESWILFKTALDNAKAVLDDPDATAPQILSAEYVLDQAYTGLTEKPSVNKDKLQELYDEYFQIENDNYDTDSWNHFQNMLKEAKKVLDNKDALQSEVDLAVQALTDAKEALKKAEVKKDDLLKAYNALKDTKNDGYTEDTWNAFQAALAKAAEYLNSDEVTQTQVDDAEQALIDTYNALTKSEGPGPNPGEVDKNALDTLYAQNKDKANDNYTEDSWNEFQAALANAKGILENKAATQDMVDGALSRLDAAVRGLTKNGEPAPEDPDRYELQGLYEQYLKRNKEDYTAESWKNFDAAMKEAERVLNADSVTEKEVQDAIDGLKAAEGKLVKAETPTDPTDPTDPSVPTGDSTVLWSYLLMLLAGVAVMIAAGIGISKKKRNIG